VGLAPGTPDEPRAVWPFAQGRLRLPGVGVRLGVLVVVVVTAARPLVPLSDGDVCDLGAVRPFETERSRVPWVVGDVDDLTTRPSLVGCVRVDPALPARAVVTALRIAPVWDALRLPISCGRRGRDHE